MPPAKKNATKKAAHVWPRIERGVVKSAARALQILEFFDDTRCEANTTTITKQLGYPLSSTASLLHSLTEIGYLRYDRKKHTYFPTSRVRILGSWVDEPLFGTSHSLALVEQLNRATGHTVYLAVRNGLFSQYIHVVQATTTLQLRLTPGTKRPIVTSASGKIFLSRMSTPEVELIIRRHNAELPRDSKPVEVKRVLEELTEIRSVGYHVSRESEVTPNAAVIAMLLPSLITQADLVLGIGGDREVILPLLHDIIGRMRSTIDGVVKGGATTD